MDLPGYLLLFSQVSRLHQPPGNEETHEIMILFIILIYLLMFN